MLDYAANGTRYWGEGALAELFERTCARIGRDPAAVLEEVVGQDADAQDFWDRAERNLRGGVVRLVFVADVIPDELATVIEFLSTRMHDTEVYGVEVRRYGSGGAAECFVPRLIGATAAAQAEKRRQTSLDEKLQNAEPEVITAAERLRFLGEEIGLPIRSTPASPPAHRLAGQRRTPLPHLSNGRVPTRPALPGGTPSRDQPGARSTSADRRDQQAGEHEVT